MIRLSFNLLKCMYSHCIIHLKLALRYCSYSKGFVHLEPPIVIRTVVVVNIATRQRFLRPHSSPHELYWPMMGRGGSRQDVWRSRHRSCRSQQISGFIVLQRCTSHCPSVRPLAVSAAQFAPRTTPAQSCVHTSVLPSFYFLFDHFPGGIGMILQPPSLVFQIATSPLP